MSFSFFKKGSKGKTPELPTKIQDALKAKQQQTQETSQRERSGPSYRTPPVQASPEQQQAEKQKAKAVGNMPSNVRAEQEKRKGVLEDMHKKQLADQAVQTQQSQTQLSQEKPLTDKEIRHQFDILQPRNPGEQRIYDDIALQTAYKEAFGAKTGTVVEGVEKYTEKLKKPKTTLILTWDATQEGREKAHAFETTFEQYLFKQIIQKENGLSQKVEVEKLPVNDVGPRAGSTNFSISEDKNKIVLSFALIHRDAKQFMMNIIDHIKAQVKPSQTVEQSQGKEAQGKEVVEQENRSSPRP